MEGQENLQNVSPTQETPPVPGKFDNLAERVEALTQEKPAEAQAEQKPDEASHPGQTVNIGDDAPEFHLTGQADELPPELKPAQAPETLDISDVPPAQAEPAPAPTQPEAAEPQQDETSKALEPIYTAPRPEQEPQKESDEPELPEWKQSEGWKKFEEMRLETARLEAASKTSGMASMNLNLEEARNRYSAQRETVAKAIEESLRKNAGENLTPEQQRDLDELVRETIFDELIQKEHDVYIKSIKENREQTKGEKIAEKLKEFASTKAVNWYLKLPRSQRLALNFGVGTAIGVGLGAAGSMGLLGYAGYRGTRVVAGAVGGSAGGEWAGKKWSQEEVDSKILRATSDIKQSGETLEAKARAYEMMKEESEKLKRKYALKRAAVTVAAGAGAGLATGILEHGFGIGGVVEAKAPNTADNLANRMPPRAGFGNAEPIKPTVPEGEMDELKSLEEVRAKVSAEETKAFNPETLKNVEVEEGDSLWKVVNKGLEQNEQFKSLTAAQKQNVIAFFANKAIAEHQQYGFESDPNFGIKLEAGKTADLSKLLSDTEEVKNIMAKAAKLSPEQQEEILKTSSKIATYLKNHPGELLTADKVNEILSTKPEVPSPAIMAHLEPLEPAMPAKIPTTLDLENKPEPELTVKAEPEPTPEPEPMSKSMASAANNSVDNDYGFREAKEALAQHDTTPEPAMPKPAVADTEITQHVEAAFKSEIDDFYGKKGLFTHTNGVDTQEWKFIAGLPAAKVVEYYQSDSSNSTLDPEIIKELTESSKHQQFLKQMKDLLDQTKGSVNPYPTENVEQFFKRLGNYVMRQNLPLAA